MLSTLDFESSDLSSNLAEPAQHFSLTVKNNYVNDFEFYKYNIVVIFNLFSCNSILFQLF